MTIAGYTSAKDLFLAARDAALELRATERQLERMDAERRRMSISYAPKVRATSTDANKTRSAIAFIDYEAIAAKRIEEDKRVIDTAVDLIYGVGYCGGVAHLMGGTCADILYMRYLENCTWATIERTAEISKTTARLYCSQAFDLIDAYGYDYVSRGLGLAAQ